MGYFEKVTNAYIDSMLAMGVSEDVVNYALFAFETGFNAGMLYNDDILLQQEMIEALLKEDNLN